MLLRNDFGFVDYESMPTEIKSKRVLFPAHTQEFLIRVGVLKVTRDLKA